MLCFALLAHNDEHALHQQIRNIRKYNGNQVHIVLYNGGNNPDFGKKVCNSENVMLCPYSTPLIRGETGRFFYDVMRWLEERKVHYDYLVYMEYDVLFVNQGFEKLLQDELNGYDFIGKLIRKLTDPHTTTWEPGVSMWKEWDRWEPFFQSGDFYGTFNPMQVYRHDIIKRMLSRIDKPMLEKLFMNTKVYALGEMLYINLAVLCGGIGKGYPKPIRMYLRSKSEIKLDEVIDLQGNPEVMFVHPVKDASVWNWICDQ